MTRNSGSDDFNIKKIPDSSPALIKDAIGLEMQNKRFANKLNPAVKFFNDFVAVNNLSLPEKIFVEEEGSVEMEIENSEIKKLEVKVDKLQDICIENKVAIARLDGKIISLESKIDSLENKIDLIEKKFDYKMDSMQKNIDTMQKNIDTKFDSMQKNFDTKFDSMQKDIHTINLKISSDAKLNRAFFIALTATVLAGMILNFFFK
jgi:hypothetical protein